MSAPSFAPDDHTRGSVQVVLVKSVDTEMYCCTGQTLIGGNGSSKVSAGKWTILQNVRFYCTPRPLT